MGVHDRGRHVLGRLVTGEPEHHPLVSSSLFPALAGGCIDTKRDVGTLFLDQVDDGETCGVKTAQRLGIADTCDHSADDGVHVKNRFGRDLSANNHRIGCGENLACDMRVLVGFETCVQNRVGNLVLRLPIRK